MMACRRVFAVNTVVMYLCLCIHQAFAQSSPHLMGDVGVAMYKTPALTRATSQISTALPYIYADYGPIYARVDTFGYRLAPMGLGHIEVATRLSFEGYQSDLLGVERRHRPNPIGLGTFQETPYGAFIFYAFHDTASAGSLLDSSYAAEVVVGDLHVYPQIGLERRDRKYVDALYGVSVAEALKSGLPTYIAGTSYSPNAAVTFEYVLVDSLKLTLQFRKRWLDKSIYESPLVNVKQQTSGFIALSHTFQ